MSNNKGHMESILSAPAGSANNLSKSNQQSIIRQNRSKKQLLEDGPIRAPPLDIERGQEVTVVNGDRSNLTWKRYTLVEINSRTGMCIVKGIADDRQRTFPRSVVKPKNWIENIKNFFRAMAATSIGSGSKNEEKQEQKESDAKEKKHYVEFYNFFHGVRFLGAEYDHNNALAIFKALDVRANGILSFQQFVNWIYGLGRVDDRGKLLTTIECVSGSRKWANHFTYYVMNMVDADKDDDLVDVEGTNANNNQKDLKCNWDCATFDKQTANTVFLISDSGKFNMPANLASFKEKFKSKLEWMDLKEKYRPSQNARECSFVVMGPGEVGKSALILKFVRGTYPHDYDPTIQDIYKKPFIVDKIPALLSILDSAGQEEFASMRYDWLKDNVDVLILCFSRSNHETFKQCEKLLNISRRLLRQLSIPQIVPILLCSTKSDLQMTEVSDEDIMELRNKYGGPTFVGHKDCSALMDEGVNEVFMEAVMMSRLWRTKDEIVIKDADYISRQQRMSMHRQALRTQSRSKLIGCIGCFCPVLAAAMHKEVASVKLNIASVPKDKFGDELALPSYSKRHFFVRRAFKWTKFGLAVLSCFFAPFVIIAQTLLFICYCDYTSEKCGCHKLLPERYDYTDKQTALLFDLFTIVVGRDPTDKQQQDTRKWFLSQTIGQKIARVVLSTVIISIFCLALYNAFLLGLNWGNVPEEDVKLSAMETLGPIQLWLLMWMCIAFYIATDIDVTPKPPSMQAMRPYVMYLNSDESLRTTAYVFLRGFAKSTLEIFTLEATNDRIFVAGTVAIIWALLPGAVRVLTEAEKSSVFLPKDQQHNALIALVIDMLFMFILILGLLMQLLSGLTKYIEWMRDITFMLDDVVCKERKVNYMNLTRHNNTLAWLEMRTYLYTIGLVLFSRQEIFVVYIIFLQWATAAYIIYRVLGEQTLKDAYGSPSFDGILFGLLILTYALLRILRTTTIIERLQTKQISLLRSQKFQIYYKRVTWHPPAEDAHEFQEGPDANLQTMPLEFATLDIDIALLPPMRSIVDDDDDTESDESHEIHPLIGGGATFDDDGSPLLSSTAAYAAEQSPQPFQEEQVGGGQYKNEEEFVFSGEYLDQSEKFVASALSICEAQDIIPRVFNIKLHVAVALSIFAATCAVLPTAGKLAFGPGCTVDDITSTLAPQ